jgi:putative transposase
VNSCDPSQELKVYKRYLPHWEIPGSVYFVTFKTIEGYKLSDLAKDITFNSIKFHDGKKYKLFTCVIMETHAHVILQPLKESEDNYFSLAQIMHSIKSYSSHKINRKMNLKGNIWLDENYDRIIRDDNDIFEKRQYIINNPQKAGLVENPEEYRWFFEISQENQNNWYNRRPACVVPLGVPV